MTDSRYFHIANPTTSASLASNQFKEQSKFDNRLVSSTEWIRARAEFNGFVKEIETTGESEETSSYEESP